MEPGLGLLIEGFSLAKTVAELTGILESMDSRIERLMDSELKTGILELQQAVISDTESTELLRSARQRFNKAIALETGYKLCLAYVSLAVCHSYLKDRSNARKALGDAVALENDIKTREWVLAALNDMYNPVNAYNPRFLKQKIRDSFKFRENIKRSFGIIKKKEPIGPATEKIIKDQIKLIHLQEIAHIELDASS
jgi:hypothetical protein